MGGVRKKAEERGLAARGGESESEPPEGLEFPAAIRNRDRDGKRERLVHTIGFFHILKTVYLHYSFWFLFCTCAFFCVCEADRFCFLKVLKCSVEV